MGKKLSEMSLAELWQLFHIFLTGHQTCWKEWYDEEEIFLKKTIPKVERISHIGSTAIVSIWAKPIIEYPDVASEYEKMKLKLWKEYEHNRDGYTNAKTEFIQKYTEKAKLIYGDRY